MPTGISVNGVDLDSIFDPYVQGTSPPLTVYEMVGVDLNTRYAPLVYGTAAAATLYEVAGADFNTLWAAFGTAQYGLACNGQAYLTQATTAANCQIQFNFNATNWSITAPLTISGTPVSGVMTAGATQYYLTYVQNTGSGAVLTNAQTGVWANLASGLYIQVDDSGPAQDLTRATITLQLRNAGGTVLSTTTFTISAKYTGI